MRQQVMTGPGGQSAIERMEAAYALYRAGARMAGLDARGSRFVGGEGPLNAPVMAVGEAPGEREDELCRPFAGRSGQLLSLLLAEAGLTRGHVFVTNVVKFRPVTFSGRNRMPYPHEVEASLHCLAEEIAVVSPAAVIALGAVAARALVPGESRPLSVLHGRVLMREGIPVLCLYHPSACLRDPRIRQATISDMRWLSDQASE